MSSLRPPGGDPPPLTTTLGDGELIELAPLAAEVAERYYDEFVDEDARYGPAGREWCLHDNLYLLAWAFGAARGDVDFERQVLWLARVLDGRDFPLARLARDLVLAGEVLDEAPITQAPQVASILRQGAGAVERVLASKAEG